MDTTKARREAAGLVLVVFLLGVVLGGVGNHLWGQRVWGMRNGPPTRDQVVSDFTRELGLTPDQQQQLGVVVDDTRVQWQALYAPLDAKKDGIRQQCRQRIRAILTPEQQQKFSDFMRRLDEQRKKDEAGH